MGKIAVPDPADDTPLIERLMDRVSRFDGRLTGTDRKVSALTEAVKALTEAVEAVAGAGEEPEDLGDGTKRPTGWWQPIDPASAQRSLTEVADWVASYWSQWPDGDKLPACWPYHPAAVTELWVAYSTWRWCEKPDRVLPRAEWLDRIRPSIAERLVKEVLVDGGKRPCSLARHVPGRGGQPEVRPGGRSTTAVRAVLSDLAGAYATGAPLPVPPQEVIDAVNAAQRSAYS